MRLAYATGLACLALSGCGLHNHSDPPKSDWIILHTFTAQTSNGPEVTTVEAVYTVNGKTYILGVVKGSQ